MKVAINKQSHGSKFVVFRLMQCGISRNCQFFRITSIYGPTVKIYPESLARITRLPKKLIFEKNVSEWFQVARTKLSPLPMLSTAMYCVNPVPS